MKSGEQARIFEAQIKIKDPEQIKAIDGLAGEQLVEWLLANGYRHEVFFMEYKQIVAALLSDFLHFIYEALTCSRKGKLTVSYALLRKPLKENLFYLEWLLAEPEELLSRFDGGLVEELELGKALPPEEKIRIIREALGHATWKEWIDADFLYQLRYDKKAHFGLEPLLQKANPLVTTMGQLRTETANFNFVFSNEDDHYSQWQQLYSFLPILLFHAVEVVEALIGTFARREEKTLDLTPLRTQVGLLLWMENGPWKIKFEKVIKKNLDELLQGDANLSSMPSHNLHGEAESSPSIWSMCNQVPNL